MESDAELWLLPYYHGLLPREDVVMLLKTHGEFLIRRSEENAGDKRSFVLSVCHKGAAKHYLFREEHGRIAVDFKCEPNGYSSVREFVESHLAKGDSVCLGANVRLLIPIGKYEWELSHSAVKSGTKLGSGAFGVVRKGVFTQKNGTAVNVAIKEAMLPKCTKEQIKEFMAEARIMRRFKHPNVILFHGVAVGQEPLMIVMELATDGALKDYLQLHSRGTKSKLYMCMGAASGLNHIHDKNIIHCDIAARNCLYSENKVKIADFGLARDLPAENQITLDKNQRLPIKWLAPETMRERICTKKTDVWAYGILCWEIFANGAPPYNDKNNEEVAMKVLTGERLTFIGETPEEFGTFITNNVWEGQSERRFDMAQVLDWIERNIARMAGSSPGGGAREKAKKEESTGRKQREKAKKEESTGRKQMTKEKGRG